MKSSSSIKQLQAIIDELRSDSQSTSETEFDIPEIYVPFLRTVLEEVGADEKTPAQSLQALHRVTQEIVDRIVEEVVANRSIWSTFKMADQENLRSEIFEKLVDAKIEGFGVLDAERLSEQLMQQAKANDDALREF